MSSLKKFAQQLWNDESAQGAAEYVLLLVVVVALVMLFRNKISAAFSGKLDTLSSDISGFTGGGTSN
jgi:Flp pilus assembly pilin Flp